MKLKETVNGKSFEIRVKAYFMTKTFFLQCKTFLELVESEEDYDSKSVTAVGVLETIGCIVGELDQQEDVSPFDVFLVCLTEQKLRTHARKFVTLKPLKTGLHDHIHIKFASHFLMCSQNVIV